MPTPKAIAKSRSNNLRTSKRSKRRNFKYPVVQYLIEKYSTINSHVANPVIDPNTGASLEFRHLIKGESKELWTTGYLKLRRLLLLDVRKLLLRDFAIAMGVG